MFLKTIKFGKQFLDILRNATDTTNMTKRLKIFQDDTTFRSEKNKPITKN